MMSRYNNQDHIDRIHCIDPGVWIVCKYLNFNCDVEDNTNLPKG